MLVAFASLVVILIGLFPVIKWFSNIFDIVKVPIVQVGSGSGHAGAAVLGASNIVQMFDGLKKKQEDATK